MKVFLLPVLAGLGLCFLSSGNISAQQPATPPASSMVPAANSPSGSKPRVYLEAASKGNHWAAGRDQSMEMSKDFEKSCPDVRITLNESNADYIVKLNHMEVGWSRDNQFQIANKDGDLISHTKEGGSINKGVKGACKIILDDWATAKK